MSGKISRTFIDDLLARVDIVDLISKHIQLRKTGSNFVARCPFHAEKSPSFSVNRNKQFYYCFGCGAGGNAVSFLMAFNHLDFVEAIEDLAAFAGVSVPKMETQVAPTGESLSAVYAVLQRVAEFYANQLRIAVEAKKAVAYLKVRGVNADFAKRFMLGFAPDQWQTLEHHFPRAALIEAGLLIAKDNGNYYDRFRGRLIFPIRDKRGRVVGFGGRVLDDSTPKYLNSPETPVFLKGREAYGLYELLSTQARPARILIVEGYMDVIALVQAGIEYVVATLGTAMSKAHLELLFRYTPEIVLCFDGDLAGRQAAWRAMEVVFDSLREGRQIRIMLLPQGLDPDLLVREEGKARFAERIASAQTLSEYFFEQLLATVNLTAIEGRAKLVAEAKPFLGRLSEGVFRDMMFDKLKELTGVAPQAAQGEMQAQRVNPPPLDKRRITAARMVIALLLQHPHLAEIVQQRDIAWDSLDYPGIPLLREVVQVISTTSIRHAVNTAHIIEAFRDTQDYKSLITLANLPILTPEEGVEQEFCDGLDGLLRQASEKFVGQLLEKAKITTLSARELETIKKMAFKRIK